MAVFTNGHLVREYMVKNHGFPANASNTALHKAVQDGLGTGAIDDVAIQKLTHAENREQLNPLLREHVAEILGETKMTSTPGPTIPTNSKTTVDDVINAAGNGDGASTGGHIRVKTPSEQYTHTKAAGKHFRTNESVRDEQGREASLPSEREYAKAGAYLKHLARGAGITEATMPEHEQQLLAETMEKDAWVGKVGSEFSKRVDPLQVKSLISDSTSGGAEINPEWFDSNLVTFPLLSGELLPFVDLRDVPRGASVEGASVGNPTVQWGTAEGTPMSLFNTDSLVAAIDTSIYNVSACIEVGIDYLADAAADVGRYLVENVGRRFATEFDKVIATGDGTTQPEGLTVASGLTTVTPSGGAGAAQTVTDYEGLMFGIGKQYRTGAGNRCAYIANDTSYQRARSIVIGASDSRRVFGMTHEDYKLLGRPYHIQADITNPTILFGDLSRYRLYRRQGMAVRWERGGKELTRKNVALLIVRARMGGRVVDANAFAKLTTGEA